jgi:hypothetical protein
MLFKVGVGSFKKYNAKMGRMSREEKDRFSELYIDTWDSGAG